MARSRGWRWALLSAAILLGSALLAVWIGWSETIDRLVHAASPEELVAILRTFGGWTPLISILLMVIQSILAPLPGSVIAAANGALYGVWWGTLLSWAGGMAGGWATYAIGYWSGKPLRRRWRMTGLWRQLIAVGASRGFWIVLIARMTPIVSLDFIGYLAGIARLPLATYLLANAIGIIPGILAYTLIGSELVKGRLLSWEIGAALLLMVMLFAMGRRWLQSKDAGRIID
ncbi:TVP38/TMEM64 family protein [Caldichromatium japonicum]|uniref:TVP38/TMEM64 family membrane protein n=1 Tax=Caldichromatium japonicum TaxID=2699430 RepID=A0A6G7VFP0_9GAMM|nr:TVP38/TMEM64 family protein [Caldichromatium japonicum]QIK38841.1 TVP38/TMEM64 family protein [Caldichromatium japonicum]